MVRWARQTCWTSCRMSRGSRCPWTTLNTWLKNTRWMGQVGLETHPLASLSYIQHHTKYWETHGLLVGALNNHVNVHVNITFVVLFHLPSTSEAEEAHDHRRLPDVPAPGGGLHSQPGSQTRVSGHAPAPQPLLHLLLTQHLPDGGPTQGTQQHRSLHQVTTLILY